MTDVKTVLKIPAVDGYKGIYEYLGIYVWILVYITPR
jgi:hypothetical protein